MLAFLLLPASGESLAQTITVEDETVGEGDGTVTVTATLDVAVPGGFSIGLSTNVFNSTATLDSDYISDSSGSVLNFTGNAGETQTYTVTIIDDSTVEEDETFSVLIQPREAGINVSNVGGVSTVTITDNDTATVTLGPETVDEGDGSVTVTATLDAAISGGSGFTVAVSTGGGTATADSDYTALAGHTLNFAGTTAGETQTFTVTIADDSTIEVAETFIVSLGTLGGTTASVDITNMATVTITDNDSTMVTLDADVTVGEEAGMVTVTATLNFVVSGGFMVDASTADGTTNRATAGSDYTAVTDQTLTFAGTAGETQTVEVTISSDTDIEADETFTVSLGNLAGTTRPVGISSTATVTIEDDERPTITLGDATVGESDDTVTVTATLDRAVSGGLTVTVTTTDGTATAGSDYTTTTTMLTFAGTTVGETQEFTVPILDDEEFEPEEMFSFTLTTSLMHADINPATVTITDDDTPPLSAGLALSPDSVAEGRALTITVTATIAGGMSVESETEVTVTVAGGTAIAGTDFTAVDPFTFTLAARATRGTGSFVLMVTEDEEDDPDETVTVSATAFGIDFTSSATLTITEGDIEAALEAVVVPELAQLSVSSVVDAVAGRIGRVVAGISAGPLVSFAGHPSAATALAANEQVLNEGGLDWQEFLGGSSFDLTLAGTETAAPAAGGQAASDGAIGIWASGDYERISSKDAGGLGEWEGDLFSAHLGIDGHLSESVLIGLAVSWSKGSFEFDDPRNNTDSRLVALSPYLGWNSGDGAGLWATVGHGRGEIEPKSQMNAKQDLTMALVAAGGNRRIGAGSVWELDIRGEVSAAQLETEASGSSAAMTADVRRLRLALEAGSLIRRDSGAQLTRSVALGIRHDGGDGDTGLGAELDGGLGWSFPVSGVTLRATGHVLLAHEGDLKEWGAGGLIHYAPQAKGRGLSLRVQPSWGRAESTPGQIWEHRVAELESADDDAPEARLVTDVGWGLPALSGRGLVTPYSGLELSEDGSPVYRLGSRVGIGSVFNIDLAGDRTKKGGRPEHGIDLHLRMQW